MASSRYSPTRRTKRPGTSRPRASSKATATRLRAATSTPSTIRARSAAGAGPAAAAGGPVFINNTNDVIAVVSYGFSGTCHGADYSWRVDTIDSYAFLAAYIDGVIAPAR